MTSAKARSFLALLAGGLIALALWLFFAKLPASDAASTAGLAREIAMENASSPESVASKTLESPQPGAVRATATAVAVDGTSFRGRIVDALDSPIEAARVELYADDVYRLHARPQQRTQSAADGSFVLPAKRDQRYLLHVQHPDFAIPDNLTGLVAHREGVNELGWITLKAGLALPGRIVSPRGQGLANIELSLKPEISRLRLDHGTRAQSLRSDLQGRFSFFGLADRRYRLHARAKQHWADAIQGGLAARPPDNEAVLIKMRPGYDVSGKLLQADGSAVKLARITAWPEQIEGVAARVTAIAKDGRFVLARLAEGRWRIRADQAGLVATGFTRSPQPGKLVLQLEAGRTKSLRLLSPGPPLPKEAYWRLRWPQSQLGPRDWSKIPLQDSLLEVQGLPTRGYDLEIRVPGFAALRLARFDAEQPRRPIQLVNEALLDVRVESPAAKPLPGFGLRLVLASGPPSAAAWSFVRSAARMALQRRTNALGRIQWNSLPAGPAWLCHAETLEPLRRVDLDLGKRKQITIRWPPRRGTIALLRPLSGPLPGPRLVQLWALDGSLQELRRVEKRWPVFFPHLRIGSYGLRMLPAAGQSARQTKPTLKIVEVSEQKTVEVRLP